MEFQDLLDDLIIRKSKNLESYKKRLMFYARIQMLIIDDFLLFDITTPTQSMAFSHLMLKRASLCKTTVFATQYAPKDWHLHVANAETSYAEFDAMRKRLLNTAFIVNITPPKEN